MDIFSQIEVPNLYAVMVNFGPLGVVLAWFMFRGEKVITEIRSLSHRIDGLTKAMLVDVLSREGTGHTARQMAQEMMAKIEARDSAARTKE